jgi:hypothetical protein
MAEAVSYALGAKIGRAQAHALVDELSEQAARDKRPLKEALLNDTRVRSHLSVAEIEKLFIPLTYQGSAQIFTERLVVESQMRAPRRSEPRVEPRPEFQPKPNPVETVLAGAPAPAMTNGPDFAKQQAPVASQANATAPAIAAYAGVAESPTPTGQVPAATLTQPAPDKLQWPGTLLHIFTNAAKQQGEPPPDRDKSKSS